MSSDFKERPAPHLDQIVFDSYDPLDERRRESLFSLGNGRLLVRGAAAWSSADAAHYPGTYRAGCYNRLVSEIAGERVDNESLVNLPNWLFLRFRIAGEDAWFTLENVEILRYRHGLDTRRGITWRECLVRDPMGRHTLIRERRLVSMATPLLAAMRLEVEPRDWSGRMEFLSGIDGDVENANVHRYRPYANRHLDTVEMHDLGGEILLHRSRTTQSRIDVAVAARTRLEAGRQAAEPEGASTPKGFIGRRMLCDLEPGAGVVLEKTAAIATSSDPTQSEPGDAARAAVETAGSFAEILAEHDRSWDCLWRRCGLSFERSGIEGNLRLRIFHVLQTASPHSAPLDVGVPPRGWQEAYRGQVFWDEMFVLPFLAFRFPDVARSMLLYRYRRLDAARTAARECGYRGAMFPWRSASTGREETPRFQLNLLTGEWMRDQTHLQRHVGSAIAFNICHYLEATGDIDFLYDYGAEMLLEIARFWASVARYDPDLGRYEIKGVLGPDEYHMAYPGATEPGLDNNAYTNIMAVWTIRRALEVLDRLPARRRDDLCWMFRVEPDELRLWEDITRRMRVVFHGDGIISQFEGYDRLAPVDKDLIAGHEGTRREDWAILAQGHSPDEFRISKQPDVLNLLYLLTQEQLLEILDRLGYRIGPDRLQAAADYYLDHIMHTSSLSHVVLAGALARLRPDESWRCFQKTLDIDLRETHGTAEGLHLGAMAGSLDVLQRHYLGMSASGGALTLDPALPPDLGAFKLRLRYRGNEVGIAAAAGRVTVQSEEGNPSAFDVVLCGARYRLRPGESCEAGES